MRPIGVELLYLFAGNGSIFEKNVAGSIVIALIMLFLSEECTRGLRNDKGLRCLAAMFTSLFLLVWSVTHLAETPYWLVGLAGITSLAGAMLLQVALWVWKENTKQQEKK